MTSLLLDKLAKQIGAATCASQKQLEKAAGAKAFADIFATADLLLVAIQKASQDLGQCESHQVEHTASKPEDPLWKNDPRSGSGGSDQEDRALAQGTCEATHSEAAVAACVKNPSLLLPCQVDELAEDRWQCIKPVLVAEIMHSVGMEAQPLPHSKILRRNVAAHGRGPAAAHKVSTLDAKSLRVAQKSRWKTLDPELAQRISILEDKVDQVMAATSNLGANLATFKEHFLHASNHAQTLLNASVQREDAFAQFYETERLDATEFEVSPAMHGPISALAGSNTGDGDCNHIFAPIDVASFHIGEGNAYIQATAVTADVAIQYIGNCRHTAIQTEASSTDVGIQCALAGLEIADAKQLSAEDEDEKKAKPTAGTCKGLRQAKMTQIADNARY